MAHSRPSRNPVPSLNVGFGKATGGKAPAAAKRAAESLREKGLLVNPVYASPNIVIFVYDEDA